ncbi:MAG TPA: amidase [Acidimicrobiales bacterium]|nr:amidase [Acidimicrobiales bacterium]
MSTFILPLDGGGAGTRVAVKDLIDMEGLPTTAGCRAVADHTGPAAADAACLAGIRAAEARGEARIVGKVNLHELAVGASGVNPWFGTPVNPLDARLVPGGSSSGSAVAVASGDADIALGTDTGGSVRIPSACCGTVGLKTTHGRIPLAGVYPLSAELDTVGPMARDVAGVVAGMALLEPGFSPGAPASTVGRLSLPGGDPAVDAAVDEALRRAGFEIVPVELPLWDAAGSAAAMLLCLGAWENNRVWLSDHPDEVGEDPTTVASLGRAMSPEDVSAHRAAASDFAAELAAALTRVQLVACPTLKTFPPVLEDAAKMVWALNTLAVNAAGVPALAMPVPAAGSTVPASLQLIGPSGGEELLVATAAVVEAALGR